MPTVDRKPSNLGAGEFYGKVPEKRALPSSILCEVVHPEAFDVPEHSHELAYFTLVLGGAYSEKFGPHVQDHDPMSLLWHRAGISHKDRIGDCGARCFTIEIKRAGIETLQQYSPIPLDFTETGTHVVWLAARLFREFKNWTSCSELIAEGLTLEMLGNAARRTSLKEDKLPPTWLPGIVNRLRAEFKMNHSTSRLAEEASIHPVHLATVFRRFHGQTIGEYTQRLRVSHASRLLIEGKHELIEIAYESGFSDQSHFNRLFKRYTGITPAEFRRSLS
jgi:AraC family transcriptional regulator